MWAKIKSWFKSSETILWARAQMLVGALMATLTATDMSPLFYTGMPAKEQWIMWGIVFAQGFITELSRRARTETVDGKLVLREDM